MSDETGQPPDTAAVSVAASPSAGELLRLAREAAGVHIAELALALKVPVKKLEALESDHYELLPDAVFVRALASGVCRALKIDSTPILDKLPQSAAPRLELNSSGLNTPFKTPGDFVGASVWNQLSRPVMLAALVLLLGALVLIFLPSMDQMLGNVPTSSETSTPVTQEVMPESPAPTKTPSNTVIPEPAAVNVPQALLPAAAKPAVIVASAPASPPVTSANSVAKLPVIQAAAQPSISAVSAPVVAPVQGTSASSGIIVFKTRGPSWIEVTDGKGAIQIRRTIQQGETVGVSGPLPLSVVIGRADNTEVQVRGKPFPLESFAADNVARFEVK